MPRLPALSVLESMEPTWRALYEASLAGARAFMQAVPLVRVVVPSPSAPDRARRAADQIKDIFASGVLRPEHESERTHQVAGELGVGKSLYFHAGRTHPDYGRAAFVFVGLAGAEQGAEATPFGLGGLLCPRLGRWHEERRCTTPVAHDAETEQATFVRDSRWTTAWRERAGEFCAA